MTQKIYFLFVIIKESACIQRYCGGQYCTVREPGEMARILYCDHLVAPGPWPDQTPHLAPMSWKCGQVTLRIGKLKKNKNRKVIHLLYVKFLNFAMLHTRSWQWQGPEAWLVPLPIVAQPSRTWDSTAELLRIKRVRNGGRGFTVAW